MKISIFIVGFIQGYFVDRPAKNWWYAENWNSEKRLGSVSERWNELNQVYPVSGNLETLFKVLNILTCLIHKFTLSKN